MDSDRASAQFHAVQDDIVVLTPDLVGRAVEQSGVFRDR